MKFLIEKLITNWNGTPKPCPYRRWENVTGMTDQVKHEGQVKTLAEWAKHYGVEYHNVQNRAFKLGYSFEDTFTPGTRRPGRRPKQVPYRGELYTVTELAEKLGITTQAVYKRLYRRKRV